MTDQALPASSDRDLWVDWSQYHRLIERLILLIHESGWTFDHILCLARGGVRVGDIISRVYDSPLAILATSSYREASGTRQGRLEIARYITTTGRDFGGRVLLVDDLVDSGHTLQQVGVHLQHEFREISEVRSAVLWYKACSYVRPDYFVEYLPTSPWIHQPFEDYDNLRPNQLKSRLAGGD